MSSGSPASRESLAKRYRLQSFLAIVVFLSIAVPASISGALLIRENYHRTLEQDSLLAAENYADLLQAGMAIPLWNVSPPLGLPLLESVSIDPAVLQVVVWTSEGDRFLDHTQNKALTADETIAISRSVTYADQALGRIELVYSLAKARARAANETRLLAVIIVIQLVCSLLTLIVVLHRRIVSPLKRLSVAAAGIAGGDLKTTIPKCRNDEFGDLSHQLEIMRGSLEENFTQLEQRVQERTVELVELNSELQGTLDKLRQTQGHLVESEKLAALGSLVAGVAHELNTPIGNGLTVATTLCESTSTIQKCMAEGLTRSALERYITDMAEGSGLVCRNLEKASELVSGFKQVAVDRTSTQRRKFNLLTIINETVLTLSPTLKRTPYRVEVKVADNVMFDSYPGPLGQVITNLLNNAVIHAFEGREHGQVNILSFCRKDHVVITVEDNGRGIQPNNLSRIFDPFFTTKLGEGGNGLGMHIVRSIVKGILGGSVRVESTLDVGTKFILELPLVAPDERPQNTDNPSPIEFLAASKLAC